MFTANTTWPKPRRNASTMCTTYSHTTRESVIIPTCALHHHSSSRFFKCQPFCDSVIVTTFPLHCKLPVLIPRLTDIKLRTSKWFSHSNSLHLHYISLKPHSILLVSMYYRTFLSPIYTLHLFSHPLLPTLTSSATSSNTYPLHVELYLFNNIPKSFKF